MSVQVSDKAARDVLRQRVIDTRVVAIVRLRDASRLEDVAQSLGAGGITALEFTLTTPGAIEAIERCRTRFGDTMLIGAGTVLDVVEARRCLEAGAQFIVSPGFDPDVLAVTHDGGALSMPGALTPTEIITAWRAGADIIKVFPARSFGPRYISDVLAPLPQIPLMPTGGVDHTNAADYLRAGAIAVAAGGNLVDAAVVARGEWSEITARARAFVEAVRSV